MADLRATMTAANYDRWFAPTVPARLEGRQVTIAVPTEAHRYCLDVRLRRRIEDALRRLRYTDVRVAFAVATAGYSAPWRDGEAATEGRLP